MVRFPAMSTPKLIFALLFANDPADPKKPKLARLQIAKAMNIPNLDNEEEWDVFTRAKWYVEGVLRSDSSEETPKIGTWTKGFPRLVHFWLLQAANGSEPLRFPDDLKDSLRDAFRKSEEWVKTLFGTSRRLKSLLTE